MGEIECFGASKRHDLDHDAHAAADKLIKKSAVGIDLILKGPRQMGKSSDEILSARITAVENAVSRFEGQAFISDRHPPPVFRQRSVLVPMMDIGVVRVAMRKRGMPVPMSMRFAWRIGRRVLVLVVLLVVMQVFVLQRLVDVSMFMAF